MWVHWDKWNHGILSHVSIYPEPNDFIFNSRLSSTRIYPELLRFSCSTQGTQGVSEKQLKLRFFRCFPSKSTPRVGNFHIPFLQNVNKHCMRSHVICPMYIINLGYFDDFEGLDYTSILRHTPTRWLSLKPCIERLLRFWDPICAYFRDHSDVGKVKSIRKILNDPSTKPILLFLIDVLTPINAYNQLLQVCNESWPWDCFREFCINFDN